MDSRWKFLLPLQLLLFFIWIVGTGWLDNHTRLVNRDFSTGTTFLYRRDYTHALPYFISADELWPGQSIQESTLGDCYLHTGNVDMAVKTLREAIKNDSQPFVENPTGPQSHFDLGEAFCLQGNISEARNEWEIANRICVAHGSPMPEAIAELNKYR